MLRRRRADQDNGSKRVPRLDSLQRHLPTSKPPFAADEPTAAGQREIVAMAWSQSSCPTIRVMSPSVTKNAW